jgi:hypothetical protein
MSSPSTQVRASVKAAILAEFAAEGITCEDDKLDSSLGQGKSRAACWPVREKEWASDANALETEVCIQVFAAYDPQINPEQAVDPAAIEGWADRLKIRLKAYRDVGDQYCWYFRVLEIEYLDDPTGNKTRFEMRVLGYGSNSAAL